jgi:hypothetical protein
VSSVVVALRSPRPDRLQHWTHSIVEGDSRPLEEVFSSHGARGPRIVWRPGPEALGPRPLGFMLAHWNALRGDATMPLASRLDGLELKPALGYISLLDVVEGGNDFRYRLFGTGVAAVSGFEMTNRRVSEFKAPSYIVEFYLAVYRAMLIRPEPVFTEHGPPATMHTAAWHRLALPLVDATGAITRIINVSVPVNREGRQI